MLVKVLIIIIYVLRVFGEMKLRVKESDFYIVFLTSGIYFLTYQRILL